MKKIIFLFLIIIANITAQAAIPGVNDKDPWQPLRTTLDATWPKVKELICDKSKLEARCKKAAVAFEQSKRTDASEIFRLNNEYLNFLTQQCLPLLLDAMSEIVVVLPVIKNGEHMLMTIGGLKENLAKMFLNRTDKEFALALRWLQDLYDHYIEALAFPDK